MILNEEKSRYGNLKLLVVDDSELSRLMMDRVLNSLGANDVSQAANGREALEVLRDSSSAIDLVFCDLRMPDMDGIELVHHASTLPNPPAFAFVSGEGPAMLYTTGALARTRNIQVVGAAAKPITRKSLEEILNSYVLEPKMVCARQQVQNFIPTRADLVAAITAGEFCLHYQPKIRLKDETVDGFESLLRWRHPIIGLISPGDFISEAERLGVINPLTEWVFGEVIKQCAEWNEAGLRTKISVNFSPTMLENLVLPDRLEIECLRAGVDPSQIVIEITESGLFVDIARGMHIMARLHLKGFALSIDDFGTGYSSLNQLRQLPFTEMKIDRSFVHGCPRDTRAQAILNSSVALARTLGMNIVAEGVEQEDEMTILRAIGIDMVQGFIISKPMAKEKVNLWVKAWRDRTREALQTAR